MFSVISSYKYFYTTESIKYLVTYKLEINTNFKFVYKEIPIIKSVFYYKFNINYSN